MRCSTPAAEWASLSISHTSPPCLARYLVPTVVSRWPAFHEPAPPPAGPGSVNAVAMGPQSNLAGNRSTNMSRPGQVFASYRMGERHTSLAQGKKGRERTMDAPLDRGRALRGPGKSGMARRQMRDLVFPSVRAARLMCVYKCHASRLLVYLSFFSSSLDPSTHP